MNVSTYTIEPEVAYKKLEVYQNIPESKRSDDDNAMIQIYKQAIKGKRIVNVLEAFKQTALNELGQPKLALARATWRTVFFQPETRWSNNALVSMGGGRFMSERSIYAHHTYKRVILPQDTWGAALTTKNLSSAVPHIPPDLRPKTGVTNLFILFEVEKWDEYPVDPFLLRHIKGYLYLVLAEWDLTDLEASLLGMMQEM